MGEDKCCFVDPKKVEGLIGSIAEYAKENGLTMLEVSQACKSVYFASIFMAGSKLVGNSEED